MENNTKACVAIHKLKADTQFAFIGDILTETDFNKIEWKQSDDSFSTSNPHSEITYAKVKTEMDKL